MKQSFGGDCIPKLEFENEIKYCEINLARLVKSAGGVWNKDEKLWEIKYREAKTPGLTHRIKK